MTETINKPINKPRSRFNRDKKTVSKPQTRRLDAHERAIMEMMRNKTKVSIIMNNGGVYEGHITEFDKYSVIVESEANFKHVLFKHAMSSFCQSGAF